MIYLNSYSYNVSIAKIFGVCSSVFLTCLQDEYNLLKANKKLNANNTMPISRQSIYDRTGLDDEKQKDIEMALSECGVLTVKPVQNVPHKNYYILNTEQLLKIINAPEPIKAVETESAIKYIKEPRVSPQSKRKTIIRSLKEKVSVESPVLKQYLCDWIDAVYSNPKGFLSTKAINITQEELYAFANGDEDKQIEVLKIAIKGGYRDISWAIENYYKQHGGIGKDGLTNNFVNYSDIKSNGSNISDEVF